MARILKEEDYNAKRDEILDAALSLVYTISYDKMTIQDILDKLKISRGAFYHYFDTKQSLLQALVDRMGQQAVQAMLPIVEDAKLTAIQKLHRYFEVSAQVKSLNKETILSLLSVWYSDDNALIRQKMTESSMNITAPLIIEPILRQGIKEEVLKVHYPEQVAKIIMGVALSLGDAMIELFLHPKKNEADRQELDAILGTYFDSIERILGVPEGSLHISNEKMFKDWLSANLQ